VQLHVPVGVCHKHTRENKDDLFHISALTLSTNVRPSSVEGADNSITVVEMLNNISQMMFL
jgi:hypothetical protein